MRCGGRSNLRRLRARAWRVVDGQHVISTRKLVDSGEEQELLEELIDRVKPPRRDDAGKDGLHYLLHTPFRHAPLRHGSRFATRAQPSLWYGSRELGTAFAESAYYRLLLLAGTTAELSPIESDVSAFRVALRSSRGIDLTVPPFDAHREDISSPVRYEPSQTLGREMREAGVEMFRYQSARAAGINLGLFSSRAFATRAPERIETWHAVATRESVEFIRRRAFERTRVAYTRGALEVDGALPVPPP